LSTKTQSFVCSSVLMERVTPTHRFKQAERKVHCLLMLLETLHADATRTDPAAPQTSPCDVDVVGSAGTCHLQGCAATIGGCPSPAASARGTAEGWPCRGRGAPATSYTLPCKSRIFAFESGFLGRIARRARNTALEWSNRALGGRRRRNNFHSCRDQSPSNPSGMTGDCKRGLSFREGMLARCNPSPMIPLGRHTCQTCKALCLNIGWGTRPSSHTMPACCNPRR